MENCVTALVTPFANGAVDGGKWDSLVHFQLENGVRKVVANGTTGESPTTSDAEKAGLVRRAVAAGGEVTAGCGSNDTSHTGHLIEAAASEGVGRALLVDCYYNGPSSLELREEHYGYLCSSFPEMKFTAYVIPGRTGCELSVEDLAHLHSGNPNLDCVKEATGNLERMRRTRELSPSIRIMSGDDDLTYRMMADGGIGASGVISVASNIAPRAVNEMCVAANAGDGRASDLAAKLAPLFSLVTVKAGGHKFRNPVPFKTAMAGLGMIDYGVRRPLGRMSAEGTRHVRSTLAQLWRDSPEILEPVGKFFDVDIDARLESDSHWISY
ncbi:dihydrodipicolinate synthase family protein [Candidatus Micrarchaeota archaeon]|nr:dihydrodipicolinate synthase family protein [Candidatus Micrarchaeota archaeon]